MAFIFDLKQTQTVYMNPVLNNFNRFVADNRNDKTAVGRLKINLLTGSYSVQAANKSAYDRKSVQEQRNGNNSVRNLLFEGVARQFGGANKIPPKVLKAMFDKNIKVGGTDADEKLQFAFATGKELKTRRVQKVLDAIKTEMSENRDLRAEQSVLNFKMTFKKYLSDASSTGADDLKKATREFFQAVWPRGWQSAKHLDPAILDKYNDARMQGYNIKHLKADFDNRLIELCDQLDQNDIDEREFKTEITSLLNDLKTLFAGSRAKKNEHVEAFCNSFENITLKAHIDAPAGSRVNRRKAPAAANGQDVPADQRNYFYEKKYQTIAQKIQVYDFSENRAYAMDDPKAVRKFVQDILYMVANTQRYGGKKTVDDLTTWLNSRLESTFAADNHQARGIAKMLADVKAMSKEVVKDKDDPLKLITTYFKTLKTTSVGTTTPAMNKWLDKVMSEVKSFQKASADVNDSSFGDDSGRVKASARRPADADEPKNTKLDNLLRRFGVTSKFTGNDRQTFDSIAKCAFGSGRNEGRKGGAGYIGLLPDGTAFKALTQSSQRGWRIGSNLTGGEIQTVNTATRKLRDWLVSSAEKISPRVKATVNRLLQPKLNSYGLDLLLRENVAKAIDCMAPYFFDQDGNESSWQTLTETGGDTYSTLADLARAASSHAMPPEA